MFCLDLLNTDFNLQSCTGRALWHLRVG